MRRRWTFRTSRQMVDIASVMSSCGSGVVYFPSLYHIFSPSGIAITMGLYFTAVVFLSFFFRCLICEVTEQISAKLGHIFTYDRYLKIWSELPRAFTPMAWGQKTLFSGPDSNYDRTYSCSGT